MAPSLFYTDRLTMDYTVLLEAYGTLGVLVETYYSLNTVRPLLVPYKGKSPTMIGRITYILDVRSSEQTKRIEEILRYAEIVGLGRSRQEGFGTVSWVGK